MSNLHSNTQLWQSSIPEKILLKPGELHIWRANIHISPSEADINYPLLSADEKARAKRFKFEKHALSFIAARATLRKILSRYISINPADIIFAVNKNGKPMLDNTIGKNRLFFNLSHAHEIAVYALSDQAAVGIDIEVINHDLDFDGIARRFFSEHENRLLQSIPSSQKAEAFFKIWTAKEAFIKAMGVGLSFPLKEFDISLNDCSAHLDSIHGDQQTAKAWSLFSIEIASQYQTNVAIKAKMPILKLWENIK